MWRPEHEKLLALLHFYAGELYGLYHNAYFQYLRELQNYRIPIIVLSSIAGFLSISNSGYVPPEFNKWVSLFVGSVNLAVTVVSLIENFKKIEVQTNKAYAGFINLRRLHDETSLLLQLPVEEREEEGKLKVKEFFERFESYIIDAPVLSEPAVDYFRLLKDKFENLQNSTELVTL